MRKLTNQEFQVYLTELLNDIFTEEEIRDCFFPGLDYDTVYELCHNGMLGQKLEELNPITYNSMYSDWQYNVKQK
jgi:hypothetical protein